MTEPGRVTNTNLQQQISDLRSRIDQIYAGIGDIKTMLHQMEERVRKLENNEAGTHPILDSKIDAAWRKIDDHEVRIKNVEQSIINVSVMIEKLRMPIQIAIWFGITAGGTIIVWIVSKWLTP